MSWGSSITQKLMRIVLLTSSTAVVIACAAFMGVAATMARQEAKADLITLSRITAQNCQVALAFSLPDDAEAVLAGLAAKPTLLQAQIYDAHGVPFASFARSGATPATGAPGRLEEPAAEFRDGRLLVLEPITKDQTYLGTLVLEDSLERVRQTLVTDAKLLAGVILVALAAAYLMGARLRRAITEPLLALTDTARAVSDHHDYSVRAREGAGGELGLLTTAFNQMLGDIQQRTTDLEKANASLLAQGEQLAQGVGVLGSQTRLILDAASTLAASATGTASAVTETSATVEQIRRAAHNVGQQAKVVAENARGAVGVSEAGRLSSAETAAAIERIRRQMESIAAGMTRLNEQIQAVGDIISTVDEMARASNLLAVNAAIEASKAGEHGRGFGVVAGEVRSLADQSKQATMQVRAILDEILKATGVAVVATREGSLSVEAGVRQSVEAGTSIASLAAGVREAAQMAMTIASATQQQLTGMDHVASAMEAVRDASAQNARTSQQLETAARSLNELGDRLRQLAGGGRRSPGA